MTDRRSVVRRLLAAHPCTEHAEQRAVEATLALLDAAADPFSRRQLPGHLTASAIVLDEARDSLLVVWHAGLGRWLQPGGHFEPGDDGPITAARRETLEETGVPLDEEAGGTLVHVDVHEIPARAGEPAHRHHDLRFAFVVPRDRSPDHHANGRSGWMRIAALADADASLRAAVACALAALRDSAGQRDAIAPR